LSIDPLVLEYLEDCFGFAESRWPQLHCCYYDMGVTGFNYCNTVSSPGSLSFNSATGFLHRALDFDILSQRHGHSKYTR